MTDTDSPRIEMYNENLGDNNIARRKPGESWNDPQQVSAYRNMIAIMQWWKSEFNRSSLDNNGMKVRVVTHERLNNWRDNAFWHNDREAVFISGKAAHTLSYAAMADGLTHETAHGVMLYAPGGLTYQMYLPQAVNEAYADIFACIKDKDRDRDRGRRTFGEDFYSESSPVLCVRNIANPHDNRASTTGPENVSEISTYGGEAHQDALIISHAAYLMHEDNEDSGATGAGLTWEEPGMVWYKSMRTGFRENALVDKDLHIFDRSKNVIEKHSGFNNVRRAVLWAAGKVKLPDEKLRRIRWAFDTVGIDGGSDYTAGGGGNVNPAYPVMSGDISVDAAHFPDEVFREYVSIVCDTNRDGVLSVVEIQAVTRMDVSERDIASLEGIKHFTALEYLDCRIHC